MRVGEFGLLEMERARRVVERDAQTFEAVVAAPQRVALELGGGAQGAGLGQVALETDFQLGRRTRGADLFDLVGDGAGPLFAAKLVLGAGGLAGRRKTFRVQQLAAGGNLDAVKVARGLGEPDLAGQHGELGLEAAELELRAVGIVHVHGQRQARAAQVERIEERFLLDEVPQADVHRHAVDVEQRRVMGIEQVQVGVLRDEALEGIERQARGGKIQAAPSQFGGELVAPFAAEAPVVRVPSRPGHAAEQGQRDGEQHQPPQPPTAPVGGGGRWP